MKRRKAFYYQLFMLFQGVRHDVEWRDGLLALEIMAVGSLKLTATPLLGFAIYFCTMHSPRHILRTQL